MGSVIVMASTSSTWSCRGCSPRARARAGRSGRGRTCGRRRAGGRSGGSGCSRGSCTSAGAAGARICEVLAMVSSVLGRGGSVVEALEAAGRPSRANGMPSASSSAKASSSVSAVVVIVTSRPRTWSIAVVVDLGEDDLLPDAHRVVAAAVERARVEPAEVADARDRDRRSGGRGTRTCARRAASPARPTGMPSRSLKLRDRLARAADVGLLAGDRGQLLLRRPRASSSPAWPRRRPC